LFTFSKKNADAEWKSISLLLPEKAQLQNFENIPKAHLYLEFIDFDYKVNCFFHPGFPFSSRVSQTRTSRKFQKPNPKIHPSDSTFSDLVKSLNAGYCIKLFLISIDS